MVNIFDTSKPYCFLDIDGVLNSVKWAKTERFKELRKERIDTAVGPFGDRIDQFDPEAVDHLNDIADWNFVLSSSWRHHHTLTELNETLQKVGFKGKLGDKTPDLRSHPGSLRGNEIYLWLQNNVSTCSGDFSRYIIFDDDSDMLLWQKDNFIHVNNEFGLGYNHIYQAKRKMDRLK